MPETRELTPEELQNIAKQGIDPTPYVGKKFPIYSDEEIGHDQNRQTAQADTSSNSGALGAGLRATAEGAIPAVAGGAGFVGGASPVLPWNAAAYAAAPETFGVSLAVPLISGAIASYGAGRLAGAAQNYVLPDSIKQQLQTDIQEHPTATTIGHLADIPLGGMSPSVGNLGNALGSIPKLLMRESLLPSERQALMQVASGSILAGGQEAVQEKMQGQPLSLKSIAEQAGIGAAFNKPNIVGQALGMHPQVTDPNALSKNKILGDLQSGNPQGLATGAKPATSQQSVEGTVIKPYGGTISQEALNFAGQPGNWVIDKNGNTRYVPLKSAAESGLHMAQLLDENAQVQPNPSVREQQITQAENERQQQINDEQLNAQKELQRQKSADEQSNLAASALDIQNSIGQNFGKGGAAPKPLVTTESGKEIYPDYTGNSEQDTTQNQQESQEDLENRRLEGNQDKYQEKSAVSTPLGEEVGRQLKEQDIPTTPTVEWYNRLKQWGANVRGVIVGEDGNLKNEKGETVNGVQFVKDGIKQVLVNPNTSSIDTLPHELYHAFIGDLETSTKPEDRALVQKLYKLSEPGLADYNSRAEKPVDIHEFVTSEQGLEYLKQQLNLNKESAVRGWWNDVKSIFKSKFTGNATLADARRFMNYRFVNDRPTPLEPITGNVATTSNTTEQKSQEESQIPAPRYVGRQEDFTGRTKGIDLYNLEHDIKDAAGNVLHSKGSTVSEGTLRKYGISVPEKNDENKYQGESRLKPSDLYHAQDDNAERLVHSQDWKYAYPRLVLEGTGDIYRELTKYDSGWYDPGYIREKLRRLNNWLSNKQTGHGHYLSDVQDSMKANPELHEKLAEAYNKLPSINDGQLYARKLTRDLAKGDINSTLAWTSQLEKWLKENPPKPARQYQPTSQIPRDAGEYSEHASSRFLYNLLRTEPELDVFRRTVGKIGELVTRGIRGYYSDKDHYFGKYFAPIERAARGLSKSDIDKVEGILMRENATGQNFRNNLDERQGKLYDAIRQSLLQKQIDQKQMGHKVKDFDANGKSFLRDAKINPTYYPNKIAPRIIDTLTEHPNSPEARQLKKDFIDYQVSQDNTPEMALAKLKAITSAWDSKQPNNTRFNAVRMTEGVGLPESWMRRGLLKNLSSYYNRVSTDFSYYKNLESKPEVKELLNPDNENGVAHAASKMIDHIQGEPFDKDEAQLKALNRVATSLLLGPLTNVHIGLSSIANSLQYLKPTEVPQAYYHAMSGMSDWYKKALEQGYLRKDFNSTSDLLDAANSNVEKLRAASSVIGRLNGRQLTDTLTKSFLQGMGDFVVRTRMAEANHGDASAQEMMKKLDADWQPNKKYSPEQFDQLASTFAGYIHGAHDPRTLPGWMMKDNIVQPFFSLMSWSIAQTNQWMKHVWEPATKGNIQPLIMSTLGAVLGGYVIQQLRQEISGKKTAIPGLQEIMNSSRGLKGNPGLLAYNFMQMASFTGWAGIASTLAKDAMDMAYKNIPQGSTFPLDEVVSESAKTAANGISAIMQAPNAEAFLQIAPRVLADIARENIQIARIAMSWGAQYGVTGETEAYKKKLNTSENELRQYRMVEGQPYDQQTESNNNPYLNLPQKQFKRTSNLGEAASEIPQLLQIAEQRANGNPEILKQQLQSLKQNTYQTVPSHPLQMMQYMSYLTRLYGPEVAQQRLHDYMMQNTLNRIKSSLVPSL